MQPKKTRRQIFNQEKENIEVLFVMNETPVEFIWLESSDKTLKFMERDYIINFMEEQDENRN